MVGCLLYLNVVDTRQIIVIIHIQMLTNKELSNVKDIHNNKNSHPNWTVTIKMEDDGV